LITEIEELDQEADRLSDRLEEYVTDKRKRDFEILLLKGDIEKRKKYPLGVPPGPSPEYLQEQRKREAEKARKDEEFQRKCEEEEENEPLMVCLKEVKPIWQSTGITTGSSVKPKPHRTRTGGVEPTACQRQSPNK
jgi:hypothetical protein